MFRNVMATVFCLIQFRGLGSKKYSFTLYTCVNGTCEQQRKKKRPRTRRNTTRRTCVTTHRYSTIYMFTGFLQDLCRISLGFL